MPFNPPGWWYPSQNASTIGDQVLPWLLSPASALYGTIASRRLSKAPKYVASIPVICIGNFTAGGTGKTPFALAVASRLTALGANPAFLTRGYGGALAGPYDVDANRDTADRTGDEPLLLARAAPTVIARDRTIGARHIERTQADVIIMDDGMQNPHLAKSLTFAVVDGTRGIGNGWTIPSGPLRAPLSAQKSLPDAVVFNGDNQHGNRLATGVSGTVLHGRVQVTDATIELAGQPVVAVSGIGNPKRFHATLEHVGASIVQRFDHPDHHAFSDADAERILDAAKRSNAMIVVTEKDEVRLKSAPDGSPRASLRERCYALPVRFTLDTGSEARLDALLDMLLRQQQQNRS